MSARPRVSIVMPTYNRKDTIGRAIRSVQAQSFDDFELIVVDDGSTDGTKDLVANLDPRLRLIVQPNQGVAGARNTALKAARGDLIAFLDSDDAWTPHHLALATAFFDAHPGEHLFTSEFWEDFGNQLVVVHPRVEVAEWYPATARRIGSTAFAQPPAHGDPYCWLFDERSQPAWLEAGLAQTPYPGAHLYRGNLFRWWRWGWLTALQPTVITRHAFERVGLIDASIPVANDYTWLAQLCRHFTAHFVSAPGAFKFEFAAGKKALLAEAHLVTGRTATQFHLDVLHALEDLFWKEAPGDPELCALRGFRQVLAAKAALSQGRRELALELLDQAAVSYPGPDTTALHWLARLPQDRVAALMYRGSQVGLRVAYGVRRVVDRARRHHESPPA